MEKNTSSASPAETPWRSFLRAFPASQSNSVIFDKSIKAVYYRNIHSTANDRGMEGPKTHGEPQVRRRPERSSLQLVID